MPSIFDDEEWELIVEASSVSVSMAWRSEVELPAAEPVVGRFRTWPTCRSVGTTPGFAASRAVTLVPVAAAMEFSVSPETMV